MTVLEYADRWTVEVDVPGALLEDVEITLTDGLLVIEGLRKPRTEEGVNEVFNDRTFSKIRRELKVREGIDQSRTEAELRDGVLTLTLYRSSESSPQKIAIRSANA
jgi:HSP20 family protein